MINEIKLTPEFKANTYKAIFAIAFFIVSYLILFAFALGLMAACVWGGFFLVVAFPRFITIALGIGLAGLGVLVLIFLIKFLFKSNKTDLSGLTRIKKENEPELFQMIDEIVQEVGTSFPNKVFL